MVGFPPEVLHTERAETTLVVELHVSKRLSAQFGRGERPAVHRAPGDPVGRIVAAVHLRQKVRIVGDLLGRHAQSAVATPLGRHGPHHLGA